MFFLKKMPLSLITVFLTLSVASCGFYNDSVPTVQSPSNKTLLPKEFIAPEIATQLTQKTLVTAKDFMVVSAHPLATQAGYDIIRQGGSAVDAAIAVQMVLNVVEPQASGIGGGGFLVHYDAKHKNILSFDGRETAPAYITPHHFLTKNNTPMDFETAATGGGSVGVPGILYALKSAHDKYGVLPWKALFQPAIQLADNGFPLGKRLHEMLKVAPYYQLLSSDYNRYFHADKSLKNVGDIVVNKPLADTFRLISQQGIDAFYKGRIAQDIVNTVNNSQKFAGKMTMNDLKNYASKIRPVSCVSYHAYKLCGMNPPSSGGVTVLQALKMLEPYNLGQYKPFSVQSVHLMASALRLAYADRNKYLADPDFISVPTERLLNDTYLTKRSRQIDVYSASPYVISGDASDSLTQYASLKITEPPSTTHLSIVDKNGNAVSMTSTIERAFGSGLSTKSGFLLNNQMTDFDFEPEIAGIPVVNSPAAGKRPRSSMAPFIVFDKNNNVKMVIGSPGGARIISYVLPKIIAVLDWNMPLNTALEMPNIVAMSASPHIEVEIQNHISKDADNVVSDLTQNMPQRGYSVIQAEETSGLHVIEIKQGHILGAADPRREGTAQGD